MVLTVMEGRVTKFKRKHASGNARRISSMKRATGIPRCSCFDNASKKSLAWSDIRAIDSRYSV
jgi:hypothetical protein